MSAGSFQSALKNRARVDLSVKVPTYRDGKACPRPHGKLLSKIVLQLWLLEIAPSLPCGRCVVDHRFGHRATTCTSSIGGSHCSSARLSCLIPAKQRRWCLALDRMWQMRIAKRIERGFGLVVGAVEDSLCARSRTEIMEFSCNGTSLVGERLKKGHVRKSQGDRRQCGR